MVLFFSVRQFNILFLLFRQSKKKKTSQTENKIPEDFPSDDVKNIETKLENEVEGITDEVETKVDNQTDKELNEDIELDTNTVKSEKELGADESLAEVESLPESQLEQPAKSSKSSKRSDRKSKSRSNRASKYVITVGSFLST